MPSAKRHLDDFASTSPWLIPVAGAKQFFRFTR
jgi:hypothetical protein